MLAGHQVPKHEFQGGEPITEGAGQIVVGLAVPEDVGESTSVHFSHKVVLLMQLREMVVQWWSVALWCNGGRGDSLATSKCRCWS